MTAFAWTLPELFRLEAFIEPSNQASVRTAEAAGFEYEGLLRSFIPIGGRRRDMGVHALVRPNVHRASGRSDQPWTISPRR